MTVPSITLETASDILRNVLGPENEHIITPEMNHNLLSALSDLIKDIKPTKRNTSGKKKRCRDPCPQCQQSLEGTPYCAIDGSPHEGYRDTVLEPIPQCDFGNSKSKDAADNNNKSHSPEVAANDCPHAPAAQGKQAQQPPKKVEAATRPLAAFGFTLSKKVIPVSKQQGSPFFHDFEDNDESRLMAKRWNYLRSRSHMDTANMWGLGEFSDEPYAMPAAGKTSRSLADFATENMMNLVSVAAAGTHRDDLDTEIIVVSFSGEDVEEYEHRPPYYGTCTQSFGNNYSLLTRPPQRSILPQSWIEAYDDSAEEWVSDESEPEDAEVCGLESRSGSDDDEDDDEDDWLDDNEAAGLLDDPTDATDVDEFARDQIAQEADQINRKKRRRNGTTVQKGKVTMDEGTLISVGGVRNMPSFESGIPEGYLSLNSFLEVLLSEPRVERKSLEKTFFKGMTTPRNSSFVPMVCDGETLGAAGGMTVVTPIPHSISTDAIEKLVQHIREFESVSIGIDNLIYEFQKKHAGICTKTDAKATVRAIANVTRRGIRLKAEYNPQQVEENGIRGDVKVA
eukprot:PhF_6_TR25295/c0_g1_i1/m.34909